MYAFNAKKRGWMDNVRFILWGPAQSLVLLDKEVREGLETLFEGEVEVLACKACSDSYGITNDLEELGVKVVYVGEMVSTMLKDGWHQLTF